MRTIGVWPMASRMVGATGRGTSVHYQLPETDSLADGVDELCRIEADALLEHRLDVADVGDRSRPGLPLMTTRSACLPTAMDADPRFAAEILRAVERRDLDRFERREAGLDQQLDLALIRIAGNDAAASRSDRCRRSAGRRP